MKNFQTVILLALFIVAASVGDALAQRNASKTASARAYYGTSITPKKAKIKYHNKRTKKNTTKVVSRKKAMKSNRMDQGSVFGRRRGYRS